MSENANREARSYPKLREELEALAVDILKVFRHAEAANLFVGRAYRRDIKTGLEPLSEADPAPMQWLLSHVAGLRDDMEELDRLLKAPLQELYPSFYEGKEAVCLPGPDKDNV